MRFLKSIKEWWRVRISNPIVLDHSITEAKLVYARCLLTNAAVIPLANGVFTSIPFATELYDTGGMHDNVINNTRITFSGGYTQARFYGIGAFSVNGVGQRAVAIAFDGGVQQQDGMVMTVPSGAVIDTKILFYTPWIDITGRVYVEFQLYQNTGGVLNSSAATAVRFGAEVRR